MLVHMKTKTVNAKKLQAPTPLMQPDESKRGDIIRQAYDVFYKNGFHAAGVDLILQGTGISKRTLYKYFDSKEDLIQAVIESYSERTKASITQYLENHTFKNPKDKILSLFDWLAGVVNSGHKTGCMAINANLEYSQKHLLIEKKTKAHFAATGKLISDLCEQAGFHEPKELAKKIQILFQGAIVSGQEQGTAEPAYLGKEVAKLLLDVSK